MNKPVPKRAYNAWLQEIRGLIAQFRVKAAQDVNSAMMQLYFTLGQNIVERQERAGWGNAIVEQLASDLQRTEGGGDSYSSRNLWYMRQYYQSYRSNKKARSLSFQIPWGQNILIFTKLNEAGARLFYLARCAEAAWSRKILLNAIKSNSHQRLISHTKQHNFGKALPVHQAEQAGEIFKDSYAFDFLNITSPILERQFEAKLISHIRDFILELGYGFTFIGSQHRLYLGKKDYSVDLLFFHRKLKSLVAIDLKIGEFEPEFVGKMNFYLNLLNKKVKLAEENPSIGIILCAEKDHVQVDYTLMGVHNPIGIAEYTTAKTLPAKLRGELPDARELKQKLIRGIKESGENS